MTQWFERARFEYHPANPPEFRVLLGLLGNESRVTPTSGRVLPAGSVWVHTLEKVRALAPSLPTVTLTKGMGLGQVAAAPDGSLVVYYQHTALGKEGGKLWALDPRSGQRRVLYDVPGTAFALRFSPNGARLAFAVITGFDRWQLVEVDVRSGSSRVLQRGSDNVFLAPAAWTSSGLIVERLRWGSDAPPEDVLALDPATGVTRPLYRGFHWGADVSPDGKRLAVATGQIGMGGDPEMSLSIRATDTGRETVVASKVKRVLSVVGWSPDGARLAYRSSDRNGNATLRVVDPAGAGAQELTFANATQGRLMDARWRSSSTLVVVAALAKETRAYDAPLNAFTVAGLKPLGSFAGGLEAPASIVYIPRP